MPQSFQDIALLQSEEAGDTDLFGKNGADFSEGGSYCSAGESRNLRNSRKSPIDLEAEENKPVRAFLFPQVAN